MRYVLLIVVGAFSFGLGVAACAVELDRNSGGDHVRGKAAPMTLDDTFDDHVSPDDGDHTDWKTFEVPGDMKVDFHAWWDDPSIDVTIHVRDQFAGRVYELNHESGKRHDEWPDMALRGGQYYLEVVAKRGSSVYTIEIKPRGGVTSTRPGTDSIAPPE